MGLSPFLPTYIDFVTFKELVIDLIGRVTRLSVETDDITE
jgi:hypothetical protein